MSKIPVGGVPTFARFLLDASEKDQRPYVSQGPRKPKSKPRNMSDCADDEAAAHANLREFTEDDPLSNIILEVEGTSLYVHREILAEWSPVFKAMFTSSFMEAEERRVKLPDKSLSDVQLLLNFMYPPCTLNVTSANVMTLLPLADEYDISELKSRCEQVLMSFDSSMDIVLAAHSFNLPELLRSFIDRCAQLPLSAIDHQSGDDVINSVPDSLKLDIYREKIVTQGHLLKASYKEKERYQVTQSKIKRWGLGTNVYPCERHRSLSEECVHCLKAFRTFVLEQFNAK